MQMRTRNRTILLAALTALLAAGCHQKRPAPSRRLQPADQFAPTPPTTLPPEVPATEPTGPATQESTTQPATEPSLQASTQPSSEPTTQAAVEPTPEPVVTA